LNAHLRRFALFVFLAISGAASAQNSFPFDVVPASPTVDDSVVLRLRPVTQGGRRLRFIDYPGYPVITRTGDQLSLFAIACYDPNPYGLSMTDDLRIGPLPPGTYRTEIVVQHNCTSFGVPPAWVWSGTFSVRGAATASIPASSPGGLAILVLALGAAAALALHRPASVNA
jgi:hypothetical protein